MGNIKKSLDLHGIRHDDAFNVVDRFIGGHIINNTGDVEIVTGFSVKMKEIVNDVVNEYGGKVIEDITNGGKLIINLR